MRVVTGTEMQRIDRRTISDFKIKGIDLMENAGKGVTDCIIKNFQDVSRKSVVVFSGKGNNGGDGFVVARLLIKKKINTKVFLLCKKEEVSGDAKISLNKLLKETKSINEISSFKDIDGLKNEIKQAGIIVDALLGTGFKGSATGLIGKVIDIINESKNPVVSIDIPSGVNADTGQVIGSCIKADLTVTLGLPKTGLLMYPGVNYAGKVEVVDIGIPEDVYVHEKFISNLTRLEDIKNLLPERKPDLHKGTAGKVLLVAGSIGYTGAACLAALSCLRSGAGLVALCVPESLNEIFEIKLTEVITVPLPETKSKSISSEALKIILDLAKGYDTLAIGPGLGKEKDTMNLVKNLILHSPIPIVLDADGINAISSNLDTLKNKKQDIIITPHSGEMSRLIHLTVDNIQNNRIEIAKNFSKKYRCTVVLKGVHTIISSTDGRIFINSTGNAGMATAGSGDVLTGIISAFLSASAIPSAEGPAESPVRVRAKLSAFDSAVAGVYIHGLAGDLAKEDKGEFGLIATDVLDNIPKAIIKVLKDN